MSKHLDGILIDETHSLAICTEIGERLRSILNENAPVPARLAGEIGRVGFSRVSFDRFGNGSF